MWLLTLLILPLFLYANPEIHSLPEAGLLTSLASEPSSVVAGCVNVISGEFFDHEVDMEVVGGEPLRVERVLLHNNSHPYVRPKTPKPEWNFTHHSTIEVSKETLCDKNSTTLYLFDYYGAGGDYSIFSIKGPPKHEDVTGKFCKDAFRYGFTNTSKGSISAQNSIKNQKITWQRDRKEILLRQSNGSFLRFDNQKTSESHYYLALESRTDLKYALYEYDSSYRPIRKRLLGLTGQLLADYTLEYTSSHGSPLIYCRGVYGQYVIYKFKEVSLKGNKDHKAHVSLLKEVIRTDKPKITYEHYEGSLYEARRKKYPEWPQVKQKCYPEGRVLGIEYYSKSYLKSKGSFSPDSCCRKFNRVRKLLAPLGSDASLHTYYLFEYHLPIGPGYEGVATTTNARGYKTTYTFNQRQRLTHVVKNGEHHLPYTEETLEWGPQDTPEEIELKKRTFGRVGAAPTYVKEYCYSLRGNVKEEKLWGHFTGTKGDLPLPEVVIKKHRYSKDIFHLLLETEEGPLKETFTYHPNTSLMASKLKSHAGGIFERDFYDYDGCGLLITHTHDDGQTLDKNSLLGVTKRTIERIEREGKGLPETIIGVYIDLSNGQEQLAKKEKCHYDEKGRLLKKDSYNALDAYSHTESWTYDDHGNPLTHTDPLGATTYWSYDANDNKIEEITPDGFKKEFVYDCMNRRTCTKEHHADGIFTFYQQYDLTGNPTVSIDPWGHQTLTHYDPFNRPILIESPSFENEKGKKVRALTTYAYNEMSLPIAVGDGLGRVTTFKYTLHGKPYHITYPDGSEETFEYDLQGQLIKEVGKTGNVTLYKRDPQGRPLLIQLFSPEGELLAETQKTYSTFHLLKEKELGGVETVYSYDFLGRKKSVKKGDETILFTYDSLGRVASQETPTVRHLYTYDLMNRPTSERIETLEGKFLSGVKTEYDALGRKTSTTEIFPESQAATYIVYDTHNMPVEMYDPEGNLTRTCLLPHFVNEKGERVRCIETIDPLGQKTRCIYDRAGHLVTEEKISPLGIPLQKCVKKYNAAHEKCFTIHKVLLNGEELEEQVEKIEYDLMGRPQAIIRAFGTSLEQKTSYTYNLAGKKLTLTRSDGITLYYTYDPLGRVTALSSSEDSIDLLFSYDLQSNLIRSEDLKSQTITTRTYDPMGRMLEEHLANGFKIAREYSPEGQLQTLTLPDTSHVRYAYEGSRLVQVERFPLQGDVYAYIYDAFEGAKSTELKLPFNLGTLRKKFTLSGRLSHLENPYFTQELKSDPLGNLLERKTTGTLESLEKFSYDPLYQLIQEEGVFNHTYAFDSLYNRREKDGTLGKINLLNQLTYEGHLEYSYDLAGQLIQKGDEHFTYDALGRLTRHEKSGEAMELRYDDLHRCHTFLRYYDGTLAYEEKRIYDGVNEIGHVRSDGESLIRILGSGLSAEIGATLAIEKNGTPYIPLHDSQGSISALINKEGILLEHYRHSAFGEEEIFDNEGRSIETALSPWRYLSKRSEGGYLFFGRRIYDPGMGRWLTPDPIGTESGPNLYAYVLNAPHTHFDPIGLFGESFGGFSQVWDVISTICSYFNKPTNPFLSAIRSGISHVGRVMSQVAYHVLPPCPLAPLSKMPFALSGTFWNMASRKVLPPAGKSPTPPSATPPAQKGMCPSSMSLSTGCSTAKKTPIKARPKFPSPTMAYASNTPITPLTASSPTSESAPPSSSASKPTPSIKPSKPFAPPPTTSAPAASSKSTPTAKAASSSTTPSPTSPLTKGPASGSPPMAPLRSSTPRAYTSVKII